MSFSTERHLVYEPVQVDMIAGLRSLVHEITAQAAAALGKNDSTVREFSHHFTRMFAENLEQKLAALGQTDAHLTELFQAFYAELDRIDHEES